MNVRKKHNVKQKILQIVASSGADGMTAKNVMEKYGTTYQNISKHLKDLEKDKKIVKKDDKYVISENYIDYLNKIADKFRYIRLKNLEGSDSFLISKIGNSREIRLYWCHLWLPMIYAGELGELFKGKTVFIACGADSDLDRYHAKAYRREGVNVKTGCCMEFTNFMISDDVLMHIYHSPDLDRALDKFFDENKPNADLYFQFKKLYSMDSEILISMEKNKDVIEIARKRFDSIFSNIKS